MKKPGFATFLVLLFALSLAFPAAAAPSLASGIAPETECPCPSCYKDEAGGDGWVIDSGSDGTTFDYVVIKAGQLCTTFNENGANSCYSVSGIGTRMVTVIELGGAGCQDISNIQAHVTPTGVVLAQFYARQGGFAAPAVVVVRWQLMTDPIMLGVIGFDVERSDFASGPWATIGTHPAIPLIIDYMHLDMGLPHLGFFYYRLKVHMLDGSSFYSDVSMVRVVVLSTPSMLK